MNYPHYELRHEAGLKFGHILHVVVSRSCEVAQVTVVKWEDDATNHQKVAPAAALHLFVRPLYSILGNSEQIAKNSCHYKDLYSCEAD